MFGFKRNITKLAIPPVTPDPARQGLGIAAILRNEAAHIAEWAAFHYRAGVRRFILYDHGSTDGTADVLRDTLPDEALTLIPWNLHIRDAHRGVEINPQVLAYAHAIQTHAQDLRWLALIDADEFLVPVAGDDLNAALAPLADAAQVSLPWQMFGRNGHATDPGGMLRHFTRRAPDPAQLKHGLNWKVIVDPGRVRAVRTHACGVDGPSVNAAGQSGKRGPGFVSTERLQLNHYYTRSDAELQRKLSRNIMASADARAHRRRVMRIVDAIEAETVADTRAADLACAWGIG